MPKKEFKVIRTDKVEGESIAPGLITKTLFDKDAADTDNLTLGIAVFNAGISCGMHTHDVEEGVFVILGRGEAIIEGKKFTLEPNLGLYLPAGSEHDFKNTTPNEPMIVLFAYSSSKPRFFRKA